MLIGILADIHEETEALRSALCEFAARGVDLVVSLGDACDSFSSTVGRSSEVVALLKGVHAIGVWGNHDIGMCYDVPDDIRGDMDPSVFEYMAGMKPYLEVDGCYFSHVEPWLDARRVEDLWYFRGPPDTPEKVRKSFDAVPHRHLFVGHFHCWMIMAPTRRIAWCGEVPIQLGEEPRYLVAVAPVLGGWCATFDTVTWVLTPVRCAA